MYPVINECPICKEPLVVTRLHCRNCDTSVEGHFTLGRFHSLSPEQIFFAETFIRCEGKINRVGEELNLSYPTVRARLHDLIRAMGYEVKEEEAAPTPVVDRKAVLDELASGVITAEIAARKLAGG
ncbi:MAG: DUF2089 domain-containing protein [Anaerolineae bacterium]|nr:DUF2089 domain-containing protein [Anaerolineae bacterium]